MLSRGLKSPLKSDRFMSLSLDKGTSLEESRGVPAPPKISVLAPQFKHFMPSKAKEKPILTGKDNSCYLSCLYIILVNNIVLFILP